jgi:hypothetical protein
MYVIADAPKANDLNSLAIMRTKLLLCLFVILLCASSYCTGFCAANTDIAYGVLVQTRQQLFRQAIDLQNQITLLNADIIDLNRRLAIKQFYLNQAAKDLADTQRSLRTIDSRL